MEQPRSTFLSKLLFIAGCYNILWGAWVMLFPRQFFEILGANTPVYPMIWQSVGLVVGVYGFGYLIASINYCKHWPIVFVGFLGKLGGPFGITYHVTASGFPAAFLVVTLFNDVIWLVPFYVMLKHALEANKGWTINVRTTIVKDYEHVKKEFNGDLFQALAGPGLKLLQYEGNSTGDQLICRQFPMAKPMHFEIIASHDHSMNWGFTDKGVSLPAVFTFWEHQHLITKQGTDSVTIDDILRYRSPNIIIGLIMYPLIWYSIYSRKWKYKRYF